MKNNRIIITAIAAAILCTSLVSCKTNQEPPKRTGNVESTITSEPTQEHFHFVEREDTTPEVIRKEVDGKEIIYIRNTCEKASFVAHDRVDSEAAQAMNSVLDAAFKSHRVSSGSMMADLEKYLEGETVDESVFPWETKVDYSCTRNDGKAISIIETVDFYSAGTLSGTTVNTYNFEPLTGARIVNIFYENGNSEAFNAMDDYIYKALIAKYGDEAQSGITYAMPNLTSIVDEGLTSWYFTETGIKVIFNPGSVAPIEKGTFELELTKEELPEFALKYFN